MVAWLHLEKGRSLAEIKAYTATQIKAIYGHPRNAKGELDVQYLMSNVSDIDEFCDLNSIFRQETRRKMKGD